MNPSCSFPGWAPPDVIAIWQDAKNDLESHRNFTRDFIEREKDVGEIPAVLDTDDLAVKWSMESIELAQERLLCRLLTYDCMKDAWDSVKRNGINSRTTALICRRAFFGPMGSEKKTPTEREKWLDDVQRTAEHLAKIILDSPLDDILIEKFWRASALSSVQIGLATGFGGKSLDNIIDTSTCFFPRPSKLSDLLLELSKNARDVAKKDLSLPKPGDPDAKRAYFVKTLTAYFDEACGKKLRSAVANFTSAAFLCEFGTRQVIRLAP